MNDVTLLPWQKGVFEWRGHVTLFILSGSRGPGKTFLLMLMLMAHLRAFGVAARPLVVREGWQDLVELQGKIYDLLCRYFPGGVERNKNEGTITVDGHGVITFTNCGDERDVAKRQGHNHTGIFADEVGAYSPVAFDCLQKFRTNLRVPVGMRPELVWTANPAGRSNTKLWRGWISKGPPWVPLQDDNGDYFMWTTATFRENSYIDQLYERQLLAGTDPVLRPAFMEGKWSATLGGEMFGDLFDPSVHLLARLPNTAGWVQRVGVDWGTASPTACLLGAQVPADVQGFCPGSIIITDECSTVDDPKDLSRGTGAPVQAVAEMILEMSSRWGIRRPWAIVDDARGLGGAGDTVVDLMRKAGIFANKPTRKDRAGGWARIRNMLAASAHGDRPGLFFSTRAVYTVQTLLEAPRGVNRVDDICPKYNCDHFLDALNYLIANFNVGRMSVGRAVGLT